MLVAYCSTMTFGDHTRLISHAHSMEAGQQGKCGVTP